MFEILLSLFLFDAVLLDTGVREAREDNYERSEKILSVVQNKTDRWYVQKMINNHSLNRKKETARYVEILETHHGEVLPERHKVLVHLIKEDLQHWKDEDLGDIARDMRMSQDRLKNANEIKKTQVIQKEIIAKLDKLIKEKEDQLNGGGSGEGDASNRDVAPPQARPATPLPDSGIDNVGGKGEADNRKFKKNNGLRIGVMEREMEARQERIRPVFSPRHRLAIEAYYRRLADAAANKR